MAKSRASGLAIAGADDYIAAIAAANGLVVATRDSGAFEAAGATVINPWRHWGLTPGRVTPAPPSSAFDPQALATLPP